MPNNLTTMAREILAIENDLPFRFDYTKEKHISVDDFEMHYFSQIWPDTSLGFGGIGGQAFTSANTYVFIPTNVDQPCFVYFAGRFAYSVPYSHAFMEDVQHGNMAPVYKAGKYRAATNHELR